MNIKEKLEQWIRGTLGLDLPAQAGGKIALVHPANLANGDFTYISNSKNPEEDLAKLQENKLPEIEKIELANGRFINFSLSKEFFAASLREIANKGSEFGQTENLKGEKIFIEHTQQNPFKEFHIGHLMPNTVGDALARILRANGAEIKVASYHGDVGLHVAKAIWGKIQKPNASWGEAYAYGANNYDENKEEIVDINKKVYSHSDEKIDALYKEGRESSLESFEKVYEKLDTHFDFHFFESESGPLGKDLVGRYVGKIFEESEGATIFRGENFEPKTHTRVFLSKESLPTYEAKEVGLAKIKREKWPEYTKSITVTANEQDSFFKVVEVAIGEVFPELKGKLKHVSHGMLKLLEGKMSSRTGNIITAESLIDEVQEKVVAKLEASKHTELRLRMTSEEETEMTKRVAIAAIKFSVLHQSVGSDIIFDFDKSISFEGDSGPYLQYTAVRANAVLEKSHQGSSLVNTEVKPLEKVEVSEVEKLLYRFPEVVERCANEYSLHFLVTYLTELAGAFNSFYANNKIIDPENSEVTNYRLALTKAVSTVLTNGLDLLGIKVPEKM